MVVAGGLAGSQSPVGPMPRRAGWRAEESGERRGREEVAGALVGNRVAPWAGKGEREVRGDVLLRRGTPH